MSSAHFLPYGHQTVEDDDVAAVAAVLRGEYLTTGPTVEAFERAFAEHVGADFAVACSNGTAGLHLAALALDLGEGDRVVVPSLTFLATANAARYVGAEVEFADVEASSGLLRENELRAALDGVAGESAKAVFPVHLNGQCVDMEAVAAVASECGLGVVEDACHALGASYRSRGGEEIPVGSCRYSDMTVFSLHPVKTITMGEGGVVATNNEGLYRRMLRYRNHGMVRDAAAFEFSEQAFDAEGGANPWYYEMPEPGFNYRASDVSCALGLSQLGKLSRFVVARDALVEYYDEALRPLAPLVQPVARAEHCRPAWHLYVVHIDFVAASVDRATLMHRLREDGIGTQVHYPPVHRQPYYRRRYGACGLPGAETYYARCLSLPLFPAMSRADVERVVDALDRAVDGADV